MNKNKKKLPIIENEFIKFERFYNLDENKMLNFSTVLTIKKTGKITKNNIKLFPARKKIIENALKNTGFKTVKPFSSFTKKEYNKNSLPLIFECN